MRPHMQLARSLGTVFVPWVSRSRTIQSLQMAIVDLHRAGFDLPFNQSATPPFLLCFCTTSTSREAPRRSTDVKTAGALHSLGDFDAEQFERQRERALDEVNEVKQESLPRGVGLAEDVVVMVEIVKRLRQAESEFGDHGRFF